MEILENEPLNTKTSFHVGGTAREYYIPSSTKELIEILREKKGQRLYVLSGGSNLLINDNKIFDNVISMKEVDSNLLDLGLGQFYIGASNRIQKVISFVNGAGYGGFEEYIGLPALFGGIIYMNAGIGSRESEKFCIADFINRVKVIEKKTAEVKWIDNEDCDFSYRHSLFQNDEFIILGAEIQLYSQDKNESNKRIEDRQTFIKKNQEFGKGCFGTCFCQKRTKLLKLVSLFPKRIWGDVYQSQGNCNWLVNDGNASFKQTKKLIDFCIFLHKITFQKVELEVRIWE